MSAPAHRHGVPAPVLDDLAPEWDEYLHGIWHTAEDAARGLLLDARAAYRDARHHPRLRAELIAAGDTYRAVAHAIRAGDPFELSEFGWPVLRPDRARPGAFPLLDAE